MQTSENSVTQQKKEKAKQDYSRNVKKLKFKLQKISNQIQNFQRKIKKLNSTSNDQIIAMKISKFCKQRKFTPQMLFRLADSKSKKLVTRIEFRNTLIAIGLKLSQDQLTRLEYFLDEDVKGDITLLEYSKYLHAFGLKTQHDPNDPFLKQTLKNIDFNKLLQIVQEDKTKQKKKQDHRILLTYEQFLKYCHKYFPELKDKQLAKIFKLLQHDQKIDLDDFIEYLKNQKEEQGRINKKNEEKKQKELIEKKKNPIIQQEQQQKIDTQTLKGKLMVVLKQHSEKQQTFHSSQFKRVQSQYKLQKGSMLSLFRQIDSKLVGSITYNDLILYYVQNQTYKPNNHILIKYSFILMGKKIISAGEKPQTLIAAFLQEETFITYQEFAKLCQVEFSLKDQMAKKLFEVLLNCPGQKIKQNCVNTSLLVSLMKVNLNSIKNNIRPILQQQYKRFMFHKHYQTICTNGIVAYKICQSIINQLAQSEKYQKWNDFQFGPSFQDELGLDSIGTHISNSNIKWHRASNLSMKDFYLAVNKDQNTYDLSSFCTNDLFYKSLETLLKHNLYIISRKSSEIIKNSKIVQESELTKLFEGLHPLAFHRFQERGIYVIQFFIKSKWVYVIIDDKIPCNEQNQPLFARTTNKCSFVPLIEKAYAKIKGSYEKIFELPSFSKYVHELSSLIMSSVPIEKNSQKENQQQLTRTLMKYGNLYARKKQIDKKQEKKQTFSQIYLGNLSLVDKKIRSTQKSGIQVNTLLQIYFSSQIKDQRDTSSVHNITFIRWPYKTNFEEKWNSKWNQKSSTYKRHQTAIMTQINKWDSLNESLKIYKNSRFEAIILDPNTITQTFNSFVEIMNFKFEDHSVLLRKEIQFQKNFNCLYKINSIDKQKNIKLIIVMNRIRAPNDTRILVSFKDSQQMKSTKILQQTIKGQFGCMNFEVPQNQHDLQFKVDKFDQNQSYIYQLSFYFENPRYSLKERDRHLLFRYVSPYEQRSKLDFDFLTENQKKFFYQHFFINANRKGFLCC